MLRILTFIAHFDVKCGFCTWKSVTACLGKTFLLASIHAPFPIKITLRLRFLLIP